MRRFVFTMLLPSLFVFPVLAGQPEAESSALNGNTVLTLRSPARTGVNGSGVQLVRSGYRVISSPGWERYEKPDGSPFRASEIQSLLDSHALGGKWIRTGDARAVTSWKLDTGAYHAYLCHAGPPLTDFFMVETSSHREANSFQGWQQEATEIRSTVNVYKNRLIPAATPVPAATVH